MSEFIFLYEQEMIYELKIWLKAYKETIQLQRLYIQKDRVNQIQHGILQVKIVIRMFSMFPEEKADLQELLMPQEEILLKQKQVLAHQDGDMKQVNLQRELVEIIRVIDQNGLQEHYIVHQELKLSQQEILMLN